MTEQDPTPDPSNEPGGNTDPKPDEKPFKAPESQAELDRIIEQRLARERQRFADYDDLKGKASKYDQLENDKKTETQRLTEDRDTHKTRADKAENELLRLRVGLAKGLTEAQAKRLVGSTKEELEADADDLLATFKGGDSGGTPSGRPTENLRGGGDPDTEPEPDLSKVVDEIPR